MEFLKILKANLHENLQAAFVGLLLISEYDENGDDVDLVVLVPDDASKLSVVKSYCNTAISMTQKFGKFISIYPVHESELKYPSTMFLHNIKDNAKYI